MNAEPQPPFPQPDGCQRLAAWHVNIVPGGASYFKSYCILFIQSKYSMCYIQGCTHRCLCSEGINYTPCQAFCYRFTGICVTLTISSVGIRVGRWNILCAQACKSYWIIPPAMAKCIQAHEISMHMSGGLCNRQYCKGIIVCFQPIWLWHLYCWCIANDTQARLFAADASVSQSRLRRCVYKVCVCV